MNRNQRRMAAYNAKKAAERQADKRISRKIDALCGCSERVLKAVNQASERKPEPEYFGSSCLPQVALYSAGHRKSENVTAR
ncbi:transcriptional regulator [Pectobacterium parmentieri]|uniref:transcriptional antitermination N peptide n=1 Tax=Pectobacterium parmentieri TaxID=1905730 RepID=UPI000F8E748B|nr:transcriptional regulator [Pectobacterium parmentieri]AZS56753.1 transcriptional regulator [Pectobacterium parmentieri]